jgi:hypothetical protein
MNEYEKEKQRGAANKKRLWPFILATVCSVPGWITLGSIVSTWLRMWWFVRHHPATEASFETHFLFSFPLVMILDFVALCLIFVSWFEAPRWCRFILPFYILLLIIWAILLLNPGEGYGP